MPYGRLEAAKSVTDVIAGSGCLDTKSHRRVIYDLTGLAVMAPRNASGEVTVEMVSVPSPTP